MKVKFSGLGAKTDDATFSAAIASLHTRGETLQMDTHRVLVALAVRWADTGDVRPVVKHVNALIAKGKFAGVRKNAISAWVEAFLGMQVVVEGDNKGLFVKGKLKPADLQINELTNKRWFDYTPEPTYTPLNFDALFSALMKKAQARVKAGVKSTDKVDTGLMAVLAEAAAKHKEAAKAS